MPPHIIVIHNISVAKKQRAALREPKTAPMMTTARAPYFCPSMPITGAAKKKRETVGKLIILSYRNIQLFLRKC